MFHRPPPSLLRALSAHHPARGKLYAPATQAAVVEFARARRSEGASWQRIAAELGMRFETVRRWHSRPSGMPTMRAVEVIAEGPRAVGVAVVSPAGHRIEGLTIEEAIAALRALG
jgi:hypothetical protein